MCVGSLPLPRIFQSLPVRDHPGFEVGLMTLMAPRNHNCDVLRLSLTVARGTLRP